MKQLKLTVFVLPALQVVLLAACGRSSAPLMSITPGVPTAAPLPAPADFPHLTSAHAPLLERHGSEFLSVGHSRVTVTGLAGRFEPEFSGADTASLAHAGYEFGVAGRSGPLDLRLVWITPPAPEQRSSGWRTGAPAVGSGIRCPPPVRHSSCPISRHTRTRTVACLPC